MYIVEITGRAAEDIASLKKSGNTSAITKIRRLLEELQEHPMSGTGLVEALKSNLSGFWSRRIDKYNRLIYTIEEEIVTVVVVSAKGHYGMK